MISIGNDTKIKNSIIGSKNDKEIKRLQQELKIKDIKIEEIRKELINQDKYISQLKIEYDKELQRKDNVINDLKSSIADYQEAVGDYQNEIVRKDNNWNELKTYIKASDDCWDLQAVLDKINELEEKVGIEK